MTTAELSISSPKVLQKMLQVLVAHVQDEETTLTGMESQLAELYREKDALNQELGVSAADDIILMNKNLLAQLEDCYAQKSALGDSSLETQVVDLYREKQDLMTELGVNSIDQVKTMITNLLAQLEDLYSQKQ